MYISKTKLLLMLPILIIMGNTTAVHATDNPDDDPQEVKAHPAEGIVPPARRIIFSVIAITTVLFVCSQTRRYSDLNTLFPSARKKEVLWHIVTFGITFLVMLVTLIFPFYKMLRDVRNKKTTKTLDDYFRKQLKQNKKIINKELEEKSINTYRQAVKRHNRLIKDWKKIRENIRKEAGLATIAWPWQTTYHPQQLDITLIAALVPTALSILGNIPRPQNQQQQPERNPEFQSLLHRLFYVSVVAWGGAFLYKNIRLIQASMLPGHRDDFAKAALKDTMMQVLLDYMDIVTTWASIITLLILREATATFPVGTRSFYATCAFILFYLGYARFHYIGKHYLVVTAYNIHLSKAKKAIANYVTSPS